MHNIYIYIYIYIYVYIYIYIILKASEVNSSILRKDIKSQNCFLKTPESFMQIITDISCHSTYNTGLNLKLILS